jgi:hypothetical protein
MARSLRARTSTKNYAQLAGALTDDDISEGIWLPCQFIAETTSPLCVDAISKGP